MLQQLIAEAILRLETILEKELAHLKYLEESRDLYSKSWWNFYSHAKRRRLESFIFRSKRDIDYLRYKIGTFQVYHKKT